MPGIPKSQSWFIQRAQDMGYESAHGGVCYGLAHMGMQAVLLEDVDTFNARLELIHSFPIKNFNEKLTVAITACRREAQNEFDRLTLEERAAFENTIPDERKPRNYDELEQDAKYALLKNIYAGEKAQSLSDIYPFFDGIEVYHQAKLYPALFEKNEHIKSQTAKSGLEIVTPQRLNHKKIVSVGSCTGSYSKNELKAYFRSMRDTFNSIDKPFSVILNASKHAIQVGFDPKTKEWIFIDANSLPAIRVREDDAIAEMVMSAFFSEDRAVFASELYATDDNREMMQEHFVAWKNSDEYREIHTVNNTKLSAKDAWGADWLYIAARANDTHSLGALLEAHTETPQETLNKNVKKSGCNALHVAASNGHYENCQRLLEQEKINPLQETDSGMSFIHYALENRDCPRLAEFLNTPELIAADKRTSLLKARNNEGENIIHVAAREGRIEFLKALLGNLSLDEKNKYINKLDNNGQTPLLLAASYGHEEIVHVLLEKGAQHNITDEDDNTFVQLALDNNHFSLLMNLNDDLKNQYDIFKKVNQKQLFKAIQKDDEDAMNVILEQQPTFVFNKNTERRTLLHKAMKKGHLTIANAILSKIPEGKLKKFLMAKDKKGNTALHLAAKQGDVQCIKMLLEKSSVHIENFLFQKNNSGLTPLHIAAKYGNADVVNELLNSLSDDEEKKEKYLTTLDDDGQMAVHYAAEGGNLAIVLRLAEDRPQDLLIENDYKQTPLVLAVRNGSAEVVSQILAIDEEVKLYEPNSTPLIYLAAKENHIEVVRALLNSNRINPQNIDDEEPVYEKTALYAAAKNENHELAQLLIDNDASIDKALLHLEDTNPIFIFLNSYRARPEEAVEELQAPVIRPEIPAEIKPRGFKNLYFSFFNKHPILRKFLLGFAIGLSIAMIGLIILTIVVATDGVALAISAPILSAIIVGSSTFFATFMGALLGVIEAIKLHLNSDIPLERQDHIAINNSDGAERRDSYQIMGEGLDMSRALSQRSSVEESDDEVNASVESYQYDSGDSLEESDEEEDEYSQQNRISIGSG